MKLGGGQAAAFFAKPDPSKAGLLLYGADAMRVSLKRQQVIRVLVGQDAEEEMRLTRISAADLRKEPALVLDEVKAQGFFPGPRVVFVEDAGDGLASVFEAALSDWEDGDATLVVTAGSLPARSKLRKLFEGGSSAVSIGVYNDPPGRDEIERNLKTAGLKNIGQAGMEALTLMARDLDPGEFQQTLEKLALYKWEDTSPVTVEDVQACMPATTDAQVDDAVNIIAEGRTAEVVPTLKRLAGQGINPTNLCILATRHFKTLHGAGSHPQGPDSALSRARPPVFGPRKERMVRQARNWGAPRLERALEVLMDTDLALRSPRPVPDMAMVERAFIRISMMRPK
ncbi:MAG: DNA polymerase III subunit delta [Rhodobacteraceae bacterium]|nr:DNA polymerase III subunit delta [Paracoccaceae bacterium]